VTILKLPNGANTQVLETTGFSGLTGGVTTGGPTDFGLHDLTVDGNKANNSAGWSARIYGSAYHVRGVEFANGSDGGVWSEWGTGGTRMESHWTDFRFFNNDVIGLDWHGPHDSRFNTGVITVDGNGTPGGIGLRTSGNATSELISNLHVWGEHARGVDCKSPAYFSNCQSEGAVRNLVCDVNKGSWIGGQIFGSNSGVEYGIQFGDAATARYWDINTHMDKFSTTGIPLHFVSSDKNSIRINLLDFPAVPTEVWDGSPGTLDDIEIVCMNNMNLAADWTRRVTAGSVSAYSDTGVRGMIIGNVPGQTYLEMHTSTTVNNATASCARFACKLVGGKVQIGWIPPGGTFRQLDIEP
jgi:hypothetical protein